MGSESKISEISLCLATVTTDSFVPGTLVMIYTFLKNHPGFNGDIVIIHGELADRNRDHLSNIYDKIRFQAVSQKLIDRIYELSREFPIFAQKEAHFYALETFRLRDYERVLFCDSDLVFRQSVEELFDLRESFIVTGDGFYYGNRPRKWVVTQTEDAGSGGKTSKYRETFNSGFMLIDQALLTDENYDGLLKLVDPAINRQNPEKLADQLIFNIYFAGQQFLISAKYNYLIGHRELIREFDGLRQDEAAVLHFNGSAKPWRSEKILDESQRHPALIKSCELWFDNYFECLQNIYIRKQMTAKKPI